MASLVADVLLSADCCEGKLEREKLSVKVASLNKNIDSIKDEMREVLHKRYVEFLPCSLKTAELASKLQEYDAKILEITSIIQVDLKEQLEASHSEVLSISQQLKETTLALQLVHKLVRIHEYLQNAGLQFIGKDFVGAVQSTEALISLVNDLYKQWGEDVSITRALKDEGLVRHEKLTHDMIELWNKKIVWQRNDEPDFIKNTPFADSCHKYMTLSVDVSQSSSSLQHELSSLMQGLHLCNNLTNLLKMFSNRLMDNFIIPIITQQCVVQTAKSETQVSIEVVIASATTSAPIPTDVCTNLKILVEFLYDNLFNVTIPAVSEMHMMTELGRHLYQKLYDLMVKECISPAVPSHKKDMDKYNLVIESVVKLQDSLVTYKFITAKDQSLLDYAKNVDTLFMNKMCRDIMATSKGLMCKNLHDSVTVEELQMKNLNLVAFSDQMKCMEGVSELDDYSSKSFQFPKCQVSNSASELVKIIRDTVTDAMGSEEKRCIRLLCTVRNLIELYLQTTPVIHKENLESLPQQTALFYNNCMYLAHCIMTQGHSFKPKQGKILKEAGITFVDLIPELRKLATDTFHAQMRNQRQMLLDSLAEAGSFQELMVDIRGFDLVENGVKKCIMQLKRLQNVWVGILPDNIYQMTLGTLANTILVALVDKLVVLDDISSDCASRLDSIFQTLQEKVPQLLQVSSNGCTEAEIHKLVAKWSRFKLASFLLDASLVDIVDYWADGKGPLAVEFTADEIKQIIKALFQSSDRRTTAISKIN